MNLRSLCVVTLVDFVFSHTLSFDFGVVTLFVVHTFCCLHFSLVIFSHAFS